MAKFDKLKKKLYKLKHKRNTLDERVDKFLKKFDESFHDELVDFIYNDFGDVDALLKKFENFEEFEKELDKKFTEPV